MSFTSIVLVLIQFGCLLYFILFSHILTAGYFFIIQTFGFLIAVWAIIVMRLGNFNVQPEVNKNAVFIQKGPYKLIRNPMYTGLIIFIGTSVVYNQNLRDSVVFLLLIIILLIKIGMEEKFLEIRFGQKYLEYKKNTFRLLPYIY